MPKTRTDPLSGCRDCGGPVDFSDDERKDFNTRGHMHSPSRCSNCRAARKTRQAESGTMPRLPQFRELRDSPLTTASCATCQQPTTVPFRVRSDRPLYCARCFHQRRVAADA